MTTGAQNGDAIVGFFFIILLVVIVVNTLIAIAVANYGERQGFRFAPLFIAGWFLGFPIVLLAIAIGAGVRAPLVQSAEIAQIETSIER